MSLPGTLNPPILGGPSQLRGQGPELFFVWLMVEVRCPSPSKQGVVIELESDHKHSFTPWGARLGRGDCGGKGAEEGCGRIWNARGWSLRCFINELF